MGKLIILIGAVLLLGACGDQATRDQEYRDFYSQRMQECARVAPPEAQVVGWGSDRSGCIYLMRAP